MAGGGIKINNIKVSGGADGKTPIFKIENGKLYNSYANGKDGSWVELGQVKGNDGVDGKDGLAGAKLLSQELIGQDEQGGNIYKQTFSDGTEAYFTAPKGQDANPEEKGTTVTVGGVAQDTWSADTKLDSQTATSPQVYCVNKKGNYLNGLAYQLVTEVQNFNGSIPQYHGNCLSCGMPIEDLDCTNKLYVDTGLDGKLDKVTTAYKIYGTDENGNQIVYRLTSSASGGNQIPVYDGAHGKAVLRTNTPIEDLDCANKKYVDTALDGKLDKATSVFGGFNLYGTKYNDATTQMWQIDSGSAMQSKIPLYWLADNAGVNQSGGGCLVTSTPKYDAHATNKKYVDDGLSGKVPITPDGFSATYAGLFGKTGAGEIEIVSKTSYWNGVENLTNYNNNGSVAAYSHRATGENVLYTGTPDMPGQAANKKYVDDNFTVYEHLIILDMGEGNIVHRFSVLSTRATPYTNASELPKNRVYTIVDDAYEQIQFVDIYGDGYVSGIEYDHNLTMWENINGTASGFFTIASDTVVKV